MTKKLTKAQLHGLGFHGDIAYRSHGGWYLTEYGDPHAEA